MAIGERLNDLMESIADLQEQLIDKNVENAQLKETLNECAEQVIVLKQKEINLKELYYKNDKVYRLLAAIDVIRKDWDDSYAPKEWQAVCDAADECTNIVATPEPKPVATITKTADGEFSFGILDNNFLFGVPDGTTLLYNQPLAPVAQEISVDLNRDGPTSLEFPHINKYDNKRWVPAEAFNFQLMERRKLQEYIVNNKQKTEVTMSVSALTQEISVLPEFKRLTGWVEAISSLETDMHEHIKDQLVFTEESRKEVKRLYARFANLMQKMHVLTENHREDTED